MGAKINNFQGFFAQKLKLHFLDRPSFNINSIFPCAEFRSSGSLIPLKDHVAEKRVSDLFQYTQKGSGSFTAVLWTELQPKSENWPWKGKLLRVLLSQLAGQPDQRLLGSCSIHSPLRGINLSFFTPMQPLLFSFGLNTFEISACSITFG